MNKKGPLLKMIHLLPPAKPNASLIINSLCTLAKRTNKVHDRPTETAKKGGQAVAYLGCCFSGSTCHIAAPC